MTSPRLPRRVAAVMIRDRSRWPVPGDTPLDRARRVAQTYRTALHQLDPHQTDVLDRQFVRLGEPWITPQQGEIDLDATMSAPDLEDYFGGEPKAATIRQWAVKGYIRRFKNDTGRTVYRVGDIVDHLAKQRRDRAERHSA